MIFSGAQIVCDDFKLRRLDIEVKDGKIVNIGENLTGDEIMDLSGKFIMPGFIDTHIHGAYGTRISDKEMDLDKFCRFEASRGVTSVAVTTATSELSELVRQVKMIKEGKKTAGGAKIEGIHLEGPFINKKLKGAMTEEFIIAPDKEKLGALIDAGEGLVKLITLAPELEGALDLIKYAKEKGLVVSMGHSDATFDEAMAGIEAGITQSTHTFNAMRPYNHREPGILGAALTSDSIKSEMICDYVHLHPATCKLIFKAKGADKINMVSDSGHAAGLTISQFEADGVIRYVVDGVVRLKDGTIAGSAKTMADCVKNLITSGIDICDVAKMASKNPAETLGIFDKTGSISVGKCADLVILDKDYNVEGSFVCGKEFKR